MSLLSNIRASIERNLVAMEQTGILGRWASVVSHETNGVVTLRTGTLPNYDHSVESYEMLLRSTAPMFVDYSVFFLEYALRADELAAHRLVFFPCPITFADAANSDEDVWETIRTTQPFTDWRLSSPLRFDYAPSEARENHASCHLHLAPHARLCVSGPVHPSLFFEFVVGLFYPDRLGDFRNERTTDPSGFNQKTITELEACLIHCNVL